jgi:hypothetical protein
MPYNPTKVGDRFGKLTVVAPHVPPERKSECQCDCGKIVKVDSASLRRGSTKSCGCGSKNARTRHGHTREHSPSSTWISWDAMLKRCIHKPEYAGRGIKVCERWQTFENFLTDMGERPPRTTLDRYPNQSGDYEPGNCRWATAKQQARNTKQNRMLTFDGKSLSVSEWAELRGMSVYTLFARLQRGWSIERALTERGSK